MFIEEISLQMEELDKYLIECDNREQLIPLEEIVATGLFDNIDEIEVFFFSFDGKYYATDVNYIKYLKHLYIGMLDKMNINRLFWS